MQQGQEVKLIHKDTVWGIRLTTATLICILGLIITVTRWQTETDHRLTNLEEHANDHVTHMPYPDKIKEFPTRKEYEKDVIGFKATQAEIKQDQKEIKADIKKILSELR